MIVLGDKQGFGDPNRPAFATAPHRGGNMTSTAQILRYAQNDRLFGMSEY